jgi:hypothetical protein
MEVRSATEGEAAQVIAHEDELSQMYQAEDQQQTGRRIDKGRTIAELSNFQTPKAVSQKKIWSKLEQIYTKRTGGCRGGKHCVGVPADVMTLDLNGRQMPDAKPLPQGRILEAGLKEVAVICAILPSELTC